MYRNSPAYPAPGLTRYGELQAVYLQRITIQTSECFFNMFKKEYMDLMAYKINWTMETIS